MMYARRLVIMCVDCGRGTAADYTLRCSECSARSDARNEKRVRAERMGHRIRWLRSRYGLTLADFSAMMRAHGRRCGICRRPLLPGGGEINSPHIDHDHETGRVRGILCRLCNLDLAAFGLDPELLPPYARTECAAWLASAPVVAYLTRDVALGLERAA